MLQQNITTQEINQIIKHDKNHLCNVTLFVN